MLFFGLDNVLPYLISIVIALSVHEFSHAYVAYRFGDPTAARQGRLTLNPMAHLDLFGFLFILVAGFGWAKPVPVNPYNFENPKVASIATTAAGPLSNLLLAFIGMIVLMLIIGSDLSNFFYVFVFVNLLLFVFNLLPFPPLDGYRITAEFLPRHTKSKIMQYEQYGMLALMIIVITPLREYTISPIFRTIIPGIIEIFRTILSPLFL